MQFWAPFTKKGVQTPPCGSCPLVYVNSTHTHQRCAHQSTKYFSCLQVPCLLSKELQPLLLHFFFFFFPSCKTWRKMADSIPFLSTEKNKQEDTYQHLEVISVKMLFLPKTGIQGMNDLAFHFGLANALHVAMTVLVTERSSVITLFGLSVPWVPNIILTYHPSHISKKNNQVLIYRWWPIATKKYQNVQSLKLEQLPESSDI